MHLFVLFNFLVLNPFRNDVYRLYYISLNISAKYTYYSANIIFLVCFFIQSVLTNFVLCDLQSLSALCPHIVYN